MASPREGGRGGAAVRDMSAGGASGLEGRERTQGALDRSLRQSWAFPLALEKIDLENRSVCVDPVFWRGSADERLFEINV